LHAAAVKRAQARQAAACSSDELIFLLLQFIFIQFNFLLEMRKNNNKLKREDRQKKRESLHAAKSSG
jgi:hypothetical protein